MDCVYNAETNAIQEKFVVTDGTSFPKCTQNCIVERLEELKTIKGINRECVIEIDRTYNSVERDRVESFYYSFRDDMRAEYGFSVSVKFMEDRLCENEKKL